MRYATLVALIIAVLLSLTQLSALETAAVTGRQSILVTATDAALLGLEPGPAPANGSGTAFYDSVAHNSLQLDFRNGSGTTAWGFVRRNTALPRTDKVRYKGLFRVTNRSGDRQCIRVYVSTVYSASPPDDLAGIYIRPTTLPYSDTGTQVAGLSGAAIGTPPASGCYTALPGEVVDVDFWFEITSTGNIIPSFDVRVEGIRVP